MKKQKTTEKLKKIELAAIRLFAQQSYKKTAIDDIVREAGVSKGLFYHYFSSKTELFKHVYITYSTQMMDKVYAAVDTEIESVDFFDRMMEISDAKIEMAMAVPYLWEFMNAALNETDPDIRSCVTEYNEREGNLGNERLMAKVNYTKFREDINLRKVYEMISWVSEGYLRKVVQEQREVSADDKHEYFELLRQLAYKPEYL